MADLRVVLRRRDYRRLLATRLSSQLGDGALGRALALPGGGLLVGVGLGLVVVGVAVLGAMARGRR